MLGACEADSEALAPSDRDCEADVETLADPDPDVDIEGDALVVTLRDAETDAVTV